MLWHLQKLCQRLRDACDCFLSCARTSWGQTSLQLCLTDVWMAASTIQQSTVFHFLSDLSCCQSLFCIVFLFPCLITRCFLCFRQVCLSVLDEPSIVEAADATAVAELAASAASQWNILLYGIRLSQSKVNAQLCTIVFYASFAFVGE